MNSTICNPAKKTLPIPVCIGEIIIGAIPLLSTNVIVYLKDITTGQVTLFQETSSPAGIVGFERGINEFSDNHTYEIYITAVNTQVKQPITIDGETADYIALNFIKCLENEDLHEALSATLELE